MRAIPGIRVSLSGRVTEFSTSWWDRYGEEPIVLLSDIRTEDGREVGQQWFRVGKAWSEVKAGDHVIFDARFVWTGERTFHLSRPTKIMQA